MLGLEYVLSLQCHKYFIKKSQETASTPEERKEKGKRVKEKKRNKKKLLRVSACTMTGCSTCEFDEDGAETCLDCYKGYVLIPGQEACMRKYSRHK